MNQTYCNLKIFFMGKYFHDDNIILSSYNLSRDCRLNVIYDISSISICIVSLNGSKFHINLSKNNTVDYLKEQIMREMNFDKIQIQLSFAGINLDNDSTLIECGIGNNSNVWLIIKNQNSDYITISVKDLSGRTENFQCNRQETVNDLKNKIEKKFHICSRKQKLMCQGKILEDDELLNDDLVGETMYVIFREISIVVMYNEKSETVQISPSKIISELKRTIESIFEIDNRDQRLIFNGEMLSNDKFTLQGYKLRHQSKVIVEYHVKQYTLKFQTLLSVHEVLLERTAVGGDLKRKIMAKCGLETDHQRLYLSNKLILDDEELFEQHKDNENMFIKVIYDIRDQVTILVNNPSENEHCLLSMEECCAISDLKENIEMKLKRPKDQQTLLCQQIVLDNNSNLSDCDINNYSIISVVDRLM